LDEQPDRAGGQDLGVGVEQPERVVERGHPCRLDHAVAERLDDGQLAVAGERDLGAGIAARGGRRGGGAEERGGGGGREAAGARPTSQSVADGSGNDMGRESSTALAYTGARPWPTHASSSSVEASPAAASPIISPISAGATSSCSSASSSRAARRGTPRGSSADCAARVGGRGSSATAPSGTRGSRPRRA